ncbi:MAG: hypothetical protein ACR2KX_00975 [Chitinophagaceae bacterium]
MYRPDERACRVTWIGNEYLPGTGLFKPPAPSETMRQAFEDTSREIMNQRPRDVKRKYPELFQWRNAVDSRRPII